MAEEADEGRIDGHAHTGKATPHPIFGLDLDIYICSDCYRRPPQKRPTYPPKAKPTEAAHKPADPYKTTTPSYSTTTKAAAYQPTPQTPQEVTSYKPPADVYNPSEDVDSFPEFPEPNFPDFTSGFIPNFNFEIPKVNREYTIVSK